MFRRPPEAPNGRLAGRLLAILLLTNIFIAVGNAQQQQQKQQQEPKRQEQTTPNIKSHYQTTRAASSFDTRALIPFAPDERLIGDAVRAAPAALRRSSTSRKTAGGLSSRLQPARSLQDWKIEDVVLLATVDGMIHARDRNTGGKLWQLSSERPMVETIYHPRNRSVDGTGEATADDFLWIVEPSENGDIYGYTPGNPLQGMQKLGITVKQLVDDMTGFAYDDVPIVYNGEKTTTLYRIDIKTGIVISWSNPKQSSMAADRGVCRQISELDSLDDEKCGATGTLTMTRTEYTVGISSKVTGEQISTIRYSEWGPNNRDQDLFNQYSETKDNRYIHSRHNGEILAIESSGSPESDRAMYKHQLGSPVARVFDVARPLNSDALDTPLVVLPQPLNPSYYGENRNVFVNKTEDGTWYALSESTYPLVTRGAHEAQCARRDWFVDMDQVYEPFEAHLQDALVGVHPFTEFTEPEISDPSPYIPLIGGGSSEPPTIGGGQNQSPSAAFEMPLISSESTQKSAATSNLGLLLFVLAIIVLGMYSSKLRKALQKSKLQEAIPFLENEVLVQPGTPGEVPIADVGLGQIAAPEAKMEEPITVVETAETNINTAVVDHIDSVVAGGEQVDGAGETPKAKKKAHRGKRGGRKEKEKKGLISAFEDPDEAVETVQPDIIFQSKSEDEERPAGLLNLHIQKDQILGHGSGGTIVFAGQFEGRDVAVKRMLGQYTDLASQEVSLLEQSEGHQNVIRYFCRRQDENFLYIALELCQASLHDLFRDGRSDEVDSKYHDLVQDIQRRPDIILRQLAEGLKHLHDFRIIHRDIKPQNMLIAYPKARTLNKGFPRLVISDFGLCRTLPENASTLIGATISAGTTGWKAPELIFQPKDLATGSSQSTSKESVNGESASGVKRAIDIFSLGCVFYYILTQGHHPFDDEEGWMGIRERNIKAGRYTMLELESRVPDALVADAKNLIAWMLKHKPEERPAAADLLVHPFFWSKEERLEFLSLASDRFDLEARDGTSLALRVLESVAEEIIGKGPTTITYDPSGSWDLGPNFLSKLDQKFIDTLGKQRKYQGHKLVDLLRALRNKHHHWDDMPDDVKKRVGSLPDGYLGYWEERFPRLVVEVWDVCRRVGYADDRRFARWFRPDVV